MPTVVVPFRRENAKLRLRPLPEEARAALTEAMLEDVLAAAGAVGDRTIIASEVGGIPDMIGDDAGICVPAGDADALAAAMLRLARDNDLREQMGLAARERYEKLFSPKVVLPLLTGIYRMVARNGKMIELDEAKTPAHPWDQFKEHGE